MKPNSRATQKYNQTNYERIEFKVVRGNKAQIKACADEMGITTNELIKRSVRAYTGLELPDVSEIKGKA